jgi:AraC-like DNA-binding protein
MAATGSLPLIDAALRGGAVALLLLLSVRLLREARRSAAGLYGGLFAACVAAYVVNSAPSLFALHPPWLWPLTIASMGNLALFWLFARACFDDGFAASWRDGLVWLGFVGVGLACALLHQPWLCRGFQALQFVFLALGIREALRGRAADLIEERRRFRVVVIIASAAYGMLIVLLEAVQRGPAFAEPLSLANAAGLLALVFAIALAQLSLSRRAQLVSAPPPSRAAPAAAAPPDEQEKALLARLRHLMEVEKAYREEGLGIAELAGKLGLPEYRLRRLINQRLGHRNFSSFVNGYRLADAMAALADPAQAEVPIITIALDAGFQSLGPFNRAFKAHAGMTPTDYRRQRLSAAGNRG